MNRDRIPEGRLRSSTHGPGKNYLLVIGINKYVDPGIQNLANAVPDAQKMAEVLISRYSFEEACLTALYDEEATRENVLDQLDRLTDILTEKDNLLIYFAGHGCFRKQANIGYLVPHNAQSSKYHSFLPNSTIRDYIRGIHAHHILLVVDSCFSGSLILNREISPFDELRKGIDTYADRVDRFRSRLGIAAGRIETVSDGWSGSHSPFARSLITFLEKNTHPRLAAQWLFQHVNTITTYNADQTPISGVLDKTMHDGGEFVFQLKPDEPQNWEKALQENQIASFRTYLQLHPNGDHAEQAHWYIALLKDSSEGFKAYRRQFPKGAYLREALDRQEYVEDRVRFQVAKRKGEVGLQRYLLDFPQGHFVQEAQQEIDRILQEEKEKQVPLKKEAAFQKDSEETKRKQKLTSLLSQAEQAEERGEYLQAKQLLSQAKQLANQTEAAEIQAKIVAVKQQIFQRKKEAKDERRKVGAWNILSNKLGKRVVYGLGGVALIVVGVIFWPEGSTQEELLTQAYQSMILAEDYPAALSLVDRALKKGPSQEADSLRAVLVGKIDSIQEIQASLDSTNGNKPSPQANSNTGEDDDIPPKTKKTPQKETKNDPEYEPPRPQEHITEKTTPRDRETQQPDPSPIVTQPLSPVTTPDILPERTADPPVDEEFLFDMNDKRSGSDQGEDGGNSGTSKDEGIDPNKIYTLDTGGKISGRAWLNPSSAIFESNSQEKGEVTFEFIINPNGIVVKVKPVGADTTPRLVQPGSQKIQRFRFSSLPPHVPQVNQKVRYTITFK